MEAKGLWNGLGESPPIKPDACPQPEPTIHLTRVFLHQGKRVSPQTQIANKQMSNKYDFIV